MAVAKNKSKSRTKSKKILLKEPETDSEKSSTEVFTIVDEGLFPAPPKLEPDILWEYRAKRAEWERAFMEHQLISYKLGKEKSNPIYRALLDLLSQEDRTRSEVRVKGINLKDIQEKVAAKLGVSVEEFINSYVVDHETGNISRTLS